MQSNFGVVPPGVVSLKRQLRSRGAAGSAPRKALRIGVAGWRHTCARASVATRSASDTTRASAARGFFARVRAAARVAYRRRSIRGRHGRLDECAGSVEPPLPGCKPRGHCQQHRGHDEQAAACHARSRCKERALPLAGRAIRRWNVPCSSRVHDLLDTHQLSRGHRLPQHGDRLRQTPADAKLRRRVERTGGARSRRLLARARSMAPPARTPSARGRPSRAAPASLATKAARGIEMAADPLTTYVITAADAAGPFIGAVPDDMMEKSKLPALGYASIARDARGALSREPEAAAAAQPRRDVSPRATRSRCPTSSRSCRRCAAAPVRPRRTRRGRRRKGLVTVTVTDRTKTLQVVNAAGQTIFHAPVTVGSENDPLPVGEWKVNGVSANPPFNYNPDLFWDAEPGAREGEDRARSEQPGRRGRGSI